MVLHKYHIYKDIEDFPGYRINCKGDVVHVAGNSVSGLRPKLDKDGIIIVRLMRDGRIYEMPVVRLVETHFR
jgi:hypothetical protein